MHNEENVEHLLKEISEKLSVFENSKQDLRKNTFIGVGAGVLAALGTVFAAYQMAQSQADRQYSLSKSHYEREVAELRREIQVKDSMVLQLISYATADPKKASHLVEALKQKVPVAMQPSSGHAK